MEKLDQVGSILGEELEVLISFEAATQRMLTCDTERLEEEMRQRDQLMERLQRLDKELAELCGEAGEEGEAVFAAARGRGEPDAMPGELLEIYNKALELRAVLGRFPESEMQALMRLRLEQEKVLMKIKATNQGSTAKAARFFSVGSGQGRGSRLGRA